MAGQREILLSVKPPYANLLVDGIKTVELRRKFPNNLQEGTLCLIYSTSPVQRVIGECKVLRVDKFPLEQLWREAASKAMIPWLDFSNYFSGLDHGYAISVYGQRRYENEVALASITGPESRAPQSYRYIPTPTRSIEL